MRTVNPNMYPKGGYMFREKDGARIFGDTWEGVIARVVKYRKRAGYPLGNPAEEVMAQACQENPVLCTEVSDPSYLTKRASLKSRILTWLNGIRAKKDNAFVDDATSRARANVCAVCPKNQPLQDGCATCKAAVRELRVAIIDRRFVDGRLNACQVLGEDLPTSVHLESQTVDDPGLPGNCWRRRTL